MPLIDTDAQIQDIMKLDLRHTFEIATTSALRVFPSSERLIIKTPYLKLINIHYPEISAVSLTHLIQTIFLAQLHTLFPAVVTLVQVCCNTPKFN